MSEAPNYTVSKRVQRVWKKFSDWYGAAVIAREFGAVPPREWCDLIDGIKSQRELDRILIEVRRHHVVAPPRFPAFAKIVENVVVAPARRNGPTLQEQLTEYLVRTKPLSRRQLINKEPLRWDYRYLDGRINAIVVPADPESNAPEFRVTLEEMHMHLKNEPVGQRLERRP